MKNLHLSLCEPSTLSPNFIAKLSCHSERTGPQSHFSFGGWYVKNLLLPLVSLVQTQNTHAHIKKWAGAPRPQPHPVAASRSSSPAHRRRHRQLQEIMIQTICVTPSSGWSLRRLQSPARPPLYRLPTSTIAVSAFAPFWLRTSSVSCIACVGPSGRFADFFPGLFG